MMKRLIIICAILLIVMAIGVSAVEETMTNPPGRQSG